MMGHKNIKNFFMLFVPRTTIECDEILMQNEMYQKENISTINIDLIPLD